MRPILVIALAAAVLVCVADARAAYVNFESSHVHPIDLTPTGGKLLAVNTPDALLEVFDVQVDGSLVHDASIPVGLEPVTVRARTDTEAWVVNNLSDTVSIVDLATGVVTRTLTVGNEPTDVVFAADRAFVAVSEEDAVKVYQLTPLTGVPTVVPLFTRDVRALAVGSEGGQDKVYAVAMKSGNQTTVVNENIIFPGAGGLSLDPARLAAMGLRDMNCTSPPPAYPPLPSGITRNPALTDPGDGVPKVGLIVKWDQASGQWRDEAGQNWSPCLPYRLPDHDLFILDASTLGLTTVEHLGTSLLEVSVHPGGKIYVPHTEARNFVRFEHPLGVQGHMVDNRLAIVDPASGHALTLVDLNEHINRASDPATNLAERMASVSQPGMLVWKGDGSVGYLTAIGSRKLFRVDGGCLTGACIFGPNRSAPASVEVGEGPTGVALDEAHDRLYVLNRLSHSIAIVQASTLTKLDEIAVHDPSPPAVLNGRRFLYDGIDGSGHGDAACASCHLSGDLDGLAWDLGDPTGDLVPYSTANDNVRFVAPLQNQPVDCPPSICAAHVGFDPQKGPMTTQTLRGMLEPLHWRGDRATMNDFNMAFVGLMGTADVGPINGKPAGLSAVDMERFRQFALGMAFPPNPYRKVDDTTPCGPRSTDPSCEVQLHGSLLKGNPTEGDLLFNTHPSDAGQFCTACHTHPFGAGGGVLGGVAPQEPTSPNAAALFNGDADASPHSDLKIPHVRNMHEKFGPVWAAPAGSPPDTKTGFGFIHDGSIPDLFRFLSASVFNLSAANQARQVRDIAAFMFHFPTGTKPAVGRQVTVPAGAPPTGTPAEESLLGTLVTLGDLGDAGRHCELVASTIAGGRLQSYHLSGGAWVTDVGGAPALSTAQLRQGASSPITFTCATIGSGQRLGGNRDEDSRLNGDDCAPADAGSWAAPSTVTGLVLDEALATTLTWDDQAGSTGSGIRYDLLGGDLATLRAAGLAAATSCVASGIGGASWDDTGGDPASDAGLYYLVRARNACGTGDLGPGRAPIQDLACP